MQPNLIVMLTHNDRTLKNAKNIFNECSDLPIACWGFKNVGLSENEMCALLDEMKKADKKTFLEVVTYSEAECLESAQFACEHGFDYLLGTLFYPSVWEYLKNKQIQYYPFVGNVSGSPSVLTGTIDEMIQQVNELQDVSVPGIDLLAYRYDGDAPKQLVKSIVSNSKLNTIVAGSIDSVDRIRTIKELQPWGFTIGSALVNQSFVNNAGFRKNLEKVIQILNDQI